VTLHSLLSVWNITMFSGTSSRTTFLVIIRVIRMSERLLTALMNEPPPYEG
jgi:hypothetical protein